MTTYVLTQGRLVLAGLLVAVAVAGCGSGSSSGAQVVPAATSAAAPAALSATDVLFVQMLIPYHQQAVMMAELADTRAENPEVKQLATDLLAAHKARIATLSGWMQALDKPTVPPGADIGEHIMPGTLSFAVVSRLAETSGARFDKGFLLKMTAHHKGALKALRFATIRKSAGPETKKLATDLQASHRADLAAMRKIYVQL